MTTRRKQTRPQRRGVEDEMLPEVTSLVENYKDKDNPDEVDERQTKDRNLPIDEDLESHTSTMIAEAPPEKKVENAPLPVAKRARRQTGTENNESKINDVNVRNSANDVAGKPTTARRSAAKITTESTRTTSCSLPRNAHRNSTSGRRRSAAVATRCRRDDNDDGHHVTRLREFVESVRATVSDATPSSRSVDKTSCLPKLTQSFQSTTTTAPTSRYDLPASQTSSSALHRDDVDQQPGHFDGIFQIRRGVNAEDQPLDLSAKDRRQTFASSLSPSLLRGREDGNYVSRRSVALANASTSTSTLDFLVRRFGDNAAITEQTENRLISHEATAVLDGILRSEGHVPPTDAAAAAAAAVFATVSSPANLFTGAVVPLMTSPRWRRDAFWSTGRWMPFRSSSFGLSRQLPALATSGTSRAKTSTAAATTGVGSSMFVARPGTKLPAAELWRKSSKIKNNGLVCGKSGFHSSSGLKLSQSRKPSHGSHKRRFRLPAHTDVGKSLSSSSVQPLRQSNCASGAQSKPPTTTSSAIDTKKQSVNQSVELHPSDPATRNNEPVKHRRAGTDSTDDKYKDNRKSPTDAIKSERMKTRTGKKPETEKSLANGSTAVASKSDAHRRPVVGCLTSLRCGGCGSHFESLFRLTLHLEETGHVPASDVTPTIGVSSSATTMSSSDRKNFASTSTTTTTGLPQRLVRGQDVWLARGVEQTDRILRCMQCNAAARSLAELTMHMVRTKHYVNIVGPGSTCSAISPSPSQLPHTSSYVRSHANPTEKLSPQQPEVINRKRRSTDRSCDGKVERETEVDIRRKKTDLANDERRSRKELPSPVGSRSSVTDSMTSSPPSPLSPPAVRQHFRFTPPVDFAQTFLTASSTEASRFNNNNSDADKNVDPFSVQSLPLGDAISRPRASFSMRNLIDVVNEGDAIRRILPSIMSSTSSYEEKDRVSFPVLTGSVSPTAVDMTSDRLTRQLELT